MKAQRDESGSLLTRDFTNILRNIELVETDFMTTLLVVVPSNDEKLFLREYESYTEFVVPRSAELIIEDDQYKLFSIVTFKKFVEEFKHKARKHKFTVRKHEPNVNLSQDVKDDLTSKLDRKKKDLNRFCSTNYGEVFKYWVHLKAIRIYVESVLRFGLPANFRAVIIEPEKKDRKETKKSTR